MNFGMDTYNFYFIEIRLIVGEGGVLKFFPNITGGTWKNPDSLRGGHEKKRKIC